MTRNYSEKRCARDFARLHALPYRQALAAVRMARRDHSAIAPYAQRLLIEAVEGCGISHWARTVEWDGIGRAEICDLGGERFVLTLDTAAPILRQYLDTDQGWHPMDIDSYIADEVVQRALFGAVIYRLDLHRGRGLTA